MIRKFWMDVRPMFVLSAMILLAITALYSWTFATTSLFEYSGQMEYELYINPPDLPKLQQEHPTGRLFSLKETPDSYLVGFDAIARSVFLLVALCLSAGGILTESSTGTTSFDLSFPLTRAQWVWRRAAMLLGLALLLALLDCAVAGAFSLWMGIGLNAGVLALSAIRLALVAIPVIGLSLCVQSLLSGRFSDPTAQGLVPLMVTTIVVLGIQIPGQMLWSLSLTDWVVFAGYGKVLPSPSLWIGLTLAVLFGAGGVLLAARRFQRVDF